MIMAFVRAWIRECSGADETCQVCTSHTLHRFPHILQHPLLIALDQFIEQPQHGLDYPRMGNDLPRVALWPSFSGEVDARR